MFEIYRKRYFEPKFTLVARGLEYHDAEEIIQHYENLYAGCTVRTLQYQITEYQIKDEFGCLHYQTSMI
jgi:hypothetical protein